MQFYAVPLGGVGFGMELGVGFRVGSWIPSRPKPGSIFQLARNRGSRMIRRIYIYAYVYIYVYICICMRCICIYVYIYIYTYVYLCVYVYIFMYIFTCMFK